MKWQSLLGLFLLASTALASGTTDRQLDTIQNSTGGSALAVPGTGTTFATDTNTLTLQNKSSYDSNNSFVNASDVTKILKFSLGSMTTGKTLTISSAQTTTQTLNIPNITGTDTISTLNSTQTFGGGSTWNGVSITPTYGGTGASNPTAHTVAVAEGSSTFSFISPTSNVGYVLTSNGTGSDPTFQAAASGAPSINGGSGSPESLLAATEISLTGINYNNYVWVVGNGGAVILTHTPSVTACTADGQKLVIIGTSNTDTVTIQDQSNLSGSGVSQNGNVTLGNGQSITYHCDNTQTLWIEDSRSN